MNALNELRQRYHDHMLGKANEQTLKKEALEHNDLGTEKDAARAGNMRVYGQTPAGRHALRGIPAIGPNVTGTQPGTDPLAELLRKEANREEDEQHG